MMRRKHSFLRDVLGHVGPIACALALFAAGSAWAQEFPPKVIKFIVVYPPGGSTDIVARIIGPSLAEVLGNTVVIEHKPGANGTIGAEFAAKAAPDGTTLLLTSSSPLVITPHTLSKIGYNTPVDFAGITTVAANPEAIAVNPKLAVTDLKSLVELARTRDVTLASSGAGGLAHLAIERLKKETGARFVHVPYRGGAPSINDTIGGHVDGVVVDLAPVYPFIQNGNVRALAVTDARRSEFLPNVASSVEQGYPNFIATNWMAVLAPAKTPRPIIDQLHAALVKAAQLPKVKEDLGKLALSSTTMASPEAFQAFLRDEYVKWGAVAKESGARAEE